MDINEAYENVFNKINELALSKEKTDKIDLHNNIFEILGVKDYEIRHSNFLAWLFNKNENPIAKEILTKFLKVLNLNNVDDLIKKDCLVLREYGENLDGQRIDILLKFEELKTIVVIENKVYSTEGNNQLKNYRLKINKNFKNYDRYFVYLTLTGEIPQDEEESKEWITMSYFSLLKILKKSNKNKLDTNLKVYIEDYISLLENKTERVMDRKKELWKLYEKNKEIREVMNEIADFVPNYKARLEKFKECLNEIEIGISGNVSFPDLHITEVQNALKQKGVDENFIAYNLVNCAGRGWSSLEIYMKDKMPYSERFYKEFRTKLYKATEKYEGSKNGTKCIYAQTLGVGEDVANESKKQKMLCENLKDYFVNGDHFKNVLEFIYTFDFNKK